MFELAAVQGLPLPGLAEIDVYVRDLPAIKAAANTLGIPVSETGFDYCGTRFNLV